MRTLATARDYAALQVEGVKALNSLLASGAGRIRDILIRSSSADGKIPLGQQGEVRRLVRREVLSWFVLDERAFGADGVTALSPYALVLNRLLAKSVALAIVQNYRLMKRRLPDDIWAWLQGSGGFQYPIAELNGAFVEGTPQVDPQRRWVPPHKWTSPDGYQLSDRVWRVGQATRDKIDRMLAAEFANGTNSVRLSQMLEQFLNPERVGVRTNMPYSRNVSYDAMRLVRTEISAAYNNAAYTAAFLNPFVAGMDWRLSPRHPKTDNCDALATIGTGGQRLRPPYPIDNAPLPPDHPNCLCSASPAVRDDNATVIEALREKLRLGALPPLSPAQPRNLLNYLLGATLAREAYAWLAEQLSL